MMINHLLIGVDKKGAQEEVAIMAEGVVTNVLDKQEVEAEEVDLHTLE